MNDFTVLAVGDVFGKPGRDFLQKRLPALKREHGVSLCIVNGENSADGNGISSESAEQLFAAGADVITTGNHAFQRAGTHVYENPRVLRPANYGEELPGCGACVVDCTVMSVQVINLSGRVFMSNADNPFTAAQKLLEARENAAVTIVDFHAEATSEKRLMGYFLDGRAGFVFGTHTHVQTADEQLLPKGTAYITDLGMTGVKQSVIGITPECADARIRLGTNARIDTAEGECMLCGALVRFDRGGKALGITRICVE